MKRGHQIIGWEARNNLRGRKDANVLSARWQTFAPLGLGRQNVFLFQGLPPLAIDGWAFGTPGASAGLPSSASSSSFLVMKPTSTAHRKRIKHFDDSRDVRELTFSCYRRLPLLTNDTWRAMLAESINRATARHSFALAAFVFMPEHFEPRAPRSGYSKRGVEMVECKLVSKPRTAAESEPANAYQAASRLGSSKLDSQFGANTAGQAVAPGASRFSKTGLQTSIETGHLFRDNPAQPLSAWGHLLNVWARRVK